MGASVAVLSDIHGVLAALDRVLAEPAVAAAERIVVTGDHTWGPQPAEVLDRLVALGDRAVLVRGNADRELLSMARGIDVGLADDPLSVWGAAALRPDQLDLLDAMPEQITLDVAGFGPVRFCHATPRDDAEVVLVDSRLELWIEVLDGLPDEVRTVVCGHTHMPFVRLAAGRLIVNPGSVGLPYGRSGAHWAVLSEGAVALHRTAMDADELIEQIARDSTWPRARDWAQRMIGAPASDLQAMAVFGPRDGR